MRKLIVIAVLCLIPLHSYAQSPFKYLRFWEMAYGAETFSSSDSSRLFSTSRTVFTYQYSFNLPLVHIGETNNISFSPGVGLMFGHPLPTDKEGFGYGFNVPLFLTFRSGTDATYYDNTRWGFAAGAGVQETILASYDPMITMTQPSIMLEGSAAAGHKKQLMKIRFTYGISGVDAGNSHIDSRFGLYLIYVPGF
jgi:hypothetical protein